MVLQKFLDETEMSEDSDQSEEEEEEEEEKEEKLNKSNENDDDDDDDDEEDVEDDDEEDDDDNDEDKGEEGKKTDSKSAPNSMSRRSLKKRKKFAEDKTTRRAGEKERRKRYEKFTISLLAVCKCNIAFLSMILFATAHKFRRAAEMREQQEKNPDEEVEGFGHKKKRLKQNKMKNSDCKLRVAVDCSYDDMMEDAGNEVALLLRCLLSFFFGYRFLLSKHSVMLFQISSSSANSYKPRTLTIDDRPSRCSFM